MTPLARARELVSGMVERLDGQRCLVMLSGGKDSVATLHLVREQLPAERVRCVHMVIVPGLDFLSRPIAAVCRRYDVEWFEVPHPIGSVFMQRSMFRKPRAGALHDTPLLVYKDIEAYAKGKAESSWVADGQRKADSLERRGMMKAWGELNERHRRVHPLADWRARDVASFVKHHRLPTTPALGKSKNSHGFGLRPDVLRDVRDRYPADYAKILEMYPHAEAILAKEEMFSEHA